MTFSSSRDFVGDPAATSVIRPFRTRTNPLGIVAKFCMASPRRGSGELPALDCKVTIRALTMTAAFTVQTVPYWHNVALCNSTCQSVRA